MYFLKFEDFCKIIKNDFSELSKQLSHMFGTLTVIIQVDIKTVLYNTLNTNSYILDPRFDITT